MLQRRIIAFCTCLLFLLTTHAQVNLQTGSATFSLPIFSWQEDKSRLRSDVALSYSSGNGLRVTDIGSNVGEGWNLIAGGVITRLPIGEPDDQQAYGQTTEHDISKYPNGYIYSSATDRPPAIGCPEALTKYPIYGGKNEKYRQHNVLAADRQLDRFSFQFNGKAGMFVLDPYSGNIGASLGDTKMKITYTLDPATLQNQGIRTTIASFTIQDVDGLIYRFSKYGLSEVLETRFCNRDLSQYEVQPHFKSRGVYHQAGFENPNYIRPWIINSWYLSEIEDVFTHRKVIFNYSSLPETINNPGGSDVSYDSWNNYVIVTHKNSIEKVPVLNSIDYPDGHKVTFKYGAARIDMPNNKILSAIDVTYTTPNKLNIPETRYLSRHMLKTSYFILNRYGNPTSAFEKRMARLCLRSVKKIGPDLKEDSPPYVFDYYMGSGATDDFVPPPFCVSHDIWGYYNGNNTVGYNSETISPVSTIASLEFDHLRGLCFLHDGVTGVYLNTKAGYAKNGLLKQVIYPTGGTLAYEYEQNTGVLNNAATNIGGVHVSVTKSTDGGYSNNCDNPLTTHYNYVLDGGGSSLWGLEMPDNSNEVSMHYSPEKRNYRWSFFKCHGGIYGCCYWAFQYPGIMSQTQSIGLYGIQKFMINAEPVLTVLSTVMTICDVIIVANGSTGIGSIVSLVVDVISSYLEAGLSCTSNDSKDGTTVTYYSYDLNGISPLPMQFKRVEVVEGAGTNGKTIQEFTSSDDYPLWYPDNPNLTARQRFAPWAYGLPLKTTIKDVDGSIVRQTENIYDFTKAKFTYEFIDPKENHGVPPNGVLSKLVSCNCQVKRNISQRYTDWTDINKYNDLASYTVNGDQDLGVDFYSMYSGRTELMTVKERVYKKTDQSKYLETVTDYTYNNGSPNYEIYSITTKQSNGNTNQKVLKYSGDFSGGVFDVLNNNNMAAVPVSSFEYLTTASGTSGYLHENALEFTQLPNGDIKPLRKLEQRTDKPVSPNGSGWSNYNGLSTNYSKFHITQLNTYDAAGNLTGAKDEGNRIVANIYDYQDKYIVASVVNADPAIDKPAYTSFETNSLGGWQLSATANYDNNNAITGASSLNLAGNSCSATLNTAKPYILSFWANNSNVTVTGGATLIKSAPVFNGFTYYEYNIAQQTSTVTISGNALIDELRLYPKMARMSTITYDPLVGKTAECDENNRITYYEYDDLARLRFVKDENKNILKMYEYNNVSKQNGCPGTYYNQLITEVFTKSTCTGDNIGSDVPYTVPANKYSSTISQEDADAKAEMEILANGQTNADQHGSCIPVYYNIEKSDSFETTSCEDGYYGGKMIYRVPARTYSSTIPGAADQMALDDIAANGQAYANDPAHAICYTDNTPIWEQVDPAQTDCRSVNGQGHLFVLAKDVNPNSSSAGSYSWQDTGPNDACSAGPYYSKDVSDTYRPTNCQQGWDPYPTFVSMPAGSYVSNVSQSDADNQAINAAQQIANSRNSCVGPTVYVSSGTIGSWGEGPQFEVVFVSQVTGDRWSFFGPGGYGIPAGGYDIYLTVTNSIHSGDYDLYMCGFTAHGTDWLYNMWVTENNCNVFSIYPHQH